MWYWVRDLLSAQGIDLRLGHAKYLQAISYANVKTDAVDAATLALQYFAEIRAEYQRYLRRKGKRIARARIAKELATIVYAMLSKEEAFNGTSCGHVLTRKKRPTWPRLASPAA